MTRGTYPPISAPLQIIAIDASASTSDNATAGRRVRAENTAPNVDPMAVPATSAVTVAENAYVVGPTTSASARVQAISYISAANPEMPRAAAGSHDGDRACCGAGLSGGGARSEEHTSELQSRGHLVCRLLL